MDQQQEIKKNKLPLKTKIAAWWMIGTGIIAVLKLVQSIFGEIMAPPMVLVSDDSADLGDKKNEVYLFILLILFLILFLANGFFLLKKKRMAWIVSVIILLVNIVGIISIFIVPSIRDKRFLDELLFSIVAGIPFITPLILLLLDRKNFWKVAS